MALTEETVQDKIEVVGDYKAVAFIVMYCIPAQRQAARGLTQTSAAKALKCKLSATPRGQMR